MSLRGDAYRKKYRIDFFNICLKYAGGKCRICGYNGCKSALTFHHLAPTDKKFGIGAIFRYNFSPEEVAKELEKCILLCYNCHMEVHFNGLSIPKYFKRYRGDIFLKLFMKDFPHSIRVSPSTSKYKRGRIHRDG